MQEVIAVRLWPKRFRNCKNNVGSPYRRVAKVRQKHRGTYDRLQELSCNKVLLSRRGVTWALPGKICNLAANVVNCNKVLSSRHGVTWALPGKMYNNKSSFVQMVPFETPSAVTGINDHSVIGSPRQANGLVIEKNYIVDLNLQRLICPDRSFSDRSPYTKQVFKIFKGCLWIFSLIWQSVSFR